MWWRIALVVIAVVIVVGLLWFFIKVSFWEGEC